MKPKQLIISAFGPYSSQVEINFDDFGTEGLFLVTGDTGAGKTTIFDAISFALYGEGSGGNARRESKSFRSDYASVDTPTFVELTFEHREKEYYIKRNPEYERPLKRGEGMTKESASVEFRSPDRDKVLTKSKEVDAEITNLLGLDREQFSQTVMIAQGDFMKILRSKSDERKKLFQKIFNTSKYEQLENILKEKNAKLEKIHARANEDIQKALDKVVVDEDFSQAKQLEEELQPAKALELIDILTKHEDCKLLKLAEETKNITEQTAEKSRRHGICQKVNDDFDTLDKAKKSAEILASKSEEIKEKEGCIAGARAAQAVLPAAKLYQASATAIKGLNATIEEAEASISKKEKNLTKANMDFDDAKKKYDTLDQLKKKVNALEEIIPVISSYSQAEKDFENAEKKQKKAFDVSRKADDEYKKVKEAFYAGQSALIAQELAEGQPCPVCGSIEHPAPAKARGELVTKEELEDADASRKTADFDLQEASKKVAETKAIREQKKQQIADAGFENTDAKQLSNQAKQIKNDIKIIEDDYKKAEEALQSARTELEKSKANKETASNQLKTEKDNFQTKKKELEESLRENGFADIKAFNDAGLGKQELVELEDEVKKYHTQVASTKDRIAEYEAKLEGKTKTDLSALEEEITTLKNRAEEISNQSKKLQSRFDANVACGETIREKLKEKNATAREYAIINELYKTVSGNLGGGKAKLKFEAYVQQFYFNQVVACANQRLKVLSDGNFHLRLKQEATNLRSQAGLELEVFDANSNAWRDVSTLSGGESFVASLALALGLSDMAQSKSGQIKLDSMFIDEGFGTLDENTLHQAMEVLSKLACGNRLIGVISHVSELKTRIDKQIIIKKTREGAEIQIQKE